MFRHFRLLLVILLLAVSPVYSFHNQGVGNCNGCHTMHNLEDNQPVDPENPGGNSYLLRDATPSDVCLSCHATNNGAVFGTDPIAPPQEKGAGNFVFLLEDNINDATDGIINPISGDKAGHSINAPSMGVSIDGTNTTAPGGNFLSADLGCTSCHNPHGNENFRLLNSTGTVQDGLYSFMYAAPDAEGISLTTSESQSNHTAYKSGMAFWCRNCHNNIHRGNFSGFQHKIQGSLGTNVANRYNVYNGTQSPTGGNPATAYLAEVPFEDINMTTSYTGGAATLSEIACMTCHRAHATSSPHAGRWDFNVDYLQDDGIVSASYPIPIPYTNTNQRPLCEKCHDMYTETEMIPVMQ